MKLVIDRSRWLRGEKDGGRLLRPTDQKMCCLGFFALACGLSKADIDDHGEPQEPFEHNRTLIVPDVLKPMVDTETEEDWDEDGEPTEKTNYSASNLAAKLMAANDDNDRPESDREAEIARLFSTAGVEVAFVDDATLLPGTATGDENA